MSQGFWTTENPTTNLGVILKEAVEFWLRLRIGHLFLLRAKKHPSWLTILHVQIGWYRTYISDHISISETSTQWNIFPFVPWFSILFLDISQISTPRKTKKFQAKKISTSIADLRIPYFWDIPICSKKQNMWNEHHLALKPLESYWNLLEFWVYHTWIEGFLKTPSSWSPKWQGPDLLQENMRYQCDSVRQLEVWF